MSMNPYESPAELEPAREPYRVPVVLQIPAIGLLILGGLSSLTILAGPFALVLAVILEEDPGWSWIEVLWLVCSPASIFIAYGSFQMRRLRRYRLCCWAARLACIPFLTPLIWMGVPLGIWALIVLRRPGVRARFAD